MKNSTTTTTVEPTTKPKVSLETRKEALTTKKDKSTFDFIKLANVTDKIENKTASKVYANCKANIYIKDITGQKTVPSFKDFVAKLPKKDSYSNWDGYKAFGKFNLKQALVEKAVTQNKNEAKK